MATKNKVPEAPNIGNSPDPTTTSRTKHIKEKQNTTREEGENYYK